MLVGERLADDDVVASGQLGEDAGRLRAGKEGPLSIPCRDARIAAAESRRQPLIADLVGAERIDGRDCGEACEPRGECRRDRVGWRSAPAGPAGRRYRSAWSRSSIQSSTVWRKLPTIIPTAASIAIAVESAPTSTDVRRSDPARLRDGEQSLDAEDAPGSCPLQRDDNPDTSAGIASAEAPINSTAAR